MKNIDILKQLNDLENLELTATNVTMTDGTNVEDNVVALQQELNGQRLRGIEITNSLLEKL